MKSFFKIIIPLLLLLVLSECRIYAEVRYCSPQDSGKAMELVKAAKEGTNYGQRIVSAAKALQGLPFAKAADNDSIGTIMVRLDSLNQRELIYLALAAAKTAELTSPGLRDFEKNLENVSRKKGTDEGFASQFLYGADFVVDNVYRGNLKEMTEYIDGGNFRTKTLDYVSRHPEEFPAMANPETADKVKVAEFGYRSHRIPHLKKHSISNKNIRELMQNGDIIILSNNGDDFDIYDIGIVSIENGEPTLIHIPHDKGMVAIDPYPLQRLFKIESQFFYGFRWLRPLE